MNTASTIIPIFAIIALGTFARRKGFLPSTFLAPANRLVYYIAIPAMIFRAIARSSLHAGINLEVVLITLACVPLAFIMGIIALHMMAKKSDRNGTFIQCAFHGNLGYIGLAVIFYYLGEEGLVQGSILAGFIMILQNFLAVLALQLFSAREPSIYDLRQFVNRILINPVILSALAGIVYAFINIPIPLILDRSLIIISGLALPMALLLIGASLSFSLVRTKFALALISSAIKLLALPALGSIVYLRFGVLPERFLPGLILLAAPPATLIYIFAKEMNGDPELAVATISVGTILSGFTYALWLHLFG
jgi:predicted permease